MNDFVWVPDPRNEEYYYLKNFEHLVAMKVANFSETLPQEHWEAVVFEDESCQKVVGRQEFTTLREAQECLESLVQVSLKNRNVSS
ncbi:MAG TPA: hypothetical protein VGJ00_02630 [Rhabdochlamydiaceae bacterium]|jgi:hypothetical protein